MTVSQPPFNASNSIIVRLKIDNKVGMLASVNRLISEMGGVVGAIDLVGPEDGVLVSDISIFTNNRSLPLKPVDPHAISSPK